MQKFLSASMSICRNTDKHSVFEKVEPINKTQMPML